MPRKSLDNSVLESMKKLQKRGISIAEISRRLNVPYQTAFYKLKGKELARQRTNPETGQPFSSKTEYRGYRARQRTKGKINQELSYVISYKLAKLGENQSWLARELGVTRQAVSSYLSGEAIPKKDLQERLFKILELPVKSLDKLLEVDLGF